VSRIRRDEEGVALILALSFMVLIGLVTTALLSSIMGAVGSRSELDDVRNRQYAAEAAVEQAIASVRALPSPGTGATCDPSSRTLNGVAIHVDCKNIPIPTRTGFTQRNVVFTSCPGTAASPAMCATADTIVRAQVNYESADGTAPTKTYIQSWTVNR
jgi:type II secretory pathway pseudopilin PulG